MTNSNESNEFGTVSIVVLNWNSYEETAQCLSSVKKLDYPDYRVIVVDNGSTDHSGERLSREFEWAKHISNGENMGFGGGCNPGIKYALSAGSDYVMLLNQDARLSEGVLQELVTVERESAASVIGATVMHQEGTVVNSDPAHYPDMFYYSGYRTNLPMYPDTTNQCENKRWFETARVEGAAALLTRDFLKKRKQAVGHYIDDSLFMYCEEIELAMWCREHGLKNVIATRAVVEHKTGASSSRGFQLYYLTRNRLLIAHRYMADRCRLIFDVLYPVSRLIIAVRMVSNGQRGIIRAIFKGLVDGYRHITGQTW